MGLGFPGQDFWKVEACPGRRGLQGTRGEKREDAGDMEVVWGVGFAFKERLTQQTLSRLPGGNPVSIERVP